VEKIWKKHWPPSVDEAAIRQPEETLPVVFARQAQRVAGKPALIFYGREITFAELHEAVARFAEGLSAEEAAVFRLSLLEERGHDDVAAALRISARRCKYLRMKLLARMAAHPQLQAALREVLEP